MADWFDAQDFAAGEPAPGSYDPAVAAGYDPSMNPAGAESDPFAYTNGSLWTPWTNKFVAPPGSSGGYSAPAYVPFNYGDASFNYKAPGEFTERYATPDKFSYGDFAAPGAFKPPTQAEAENDQGYQFAVGQGAKQIQASKAMQGVLKTGGTGKALVNYGQEAGSTQYDKVYGRRANEYDRTYGAAKDVYGINRGNAAENFDRNTAAGLAAFNARQGAWRGNADVNLQGQTLGFNVATGLYDRNYQKARTGYEDARSAAAASASAGSANANQAYNRALSEYTMGRDEFWTNQDRQQGLVDRNQNQSNFYAGLGAGYAGQYGDITMGQGNAEASGTVGSSNAWGQTLGGIANAGMSAAMYYGTKPENRRF